MTAGKFITFEGGEGAGKSTQVRLLAEALTSRGLTVVQTREPGGAPQAELLRDLLISGDADRWSPEAEALLNYAARDDHLRSTIRPALEAGSWVLCDRFADSTRAYQGLAGNVAMEMIDAVHAQIVGATDPDLTLILNIAPETGLARAHARGDANRFEMKGLAFHQRLQESFLELADRFKERSVVIDASGSIDEISSAIWNAVETRLLKP
ncbi:MAG: dTMP kinase [Pseudomonadota bacterium]